MGGTNKILTISYGTFSCALEGFDDSFAVMQGIIGYLRDLDSGERPAGIEPPEPAPEALTRIAERESGQRVGARTGEGGIVLCVRDEARSSVGGAADRAAQPQVPATAEPVADNATPHQFTPDSMAGKLDHIRAVIARNKAVPSAPAEGNGGRSAKPLVLKADAPAGDEGARDVQGEDAASGPLLPDHAVPESKDAAPRAAEAPREPGDDQALAAALDTILKEEKKTRKEDNARKQDEARKEAPPRTQDTPPNKPRNGRKILADDDSGEGASVARLLEETNSLLDNPETSRRRSAISHLRAAVAATVADRKAASEMTDRQVWGEDAYRADLARVVHPPPPAREKSGVQQSGDPGPQSAPMVLTSLQRIDRFGAGAGDGKAGEQPTDPVPGATGVARNGANTAGASGDNTDETIFAADTSFRNFAEGAGAESLPDLLEAAAAYTRFVEGSPDFKRPHIMALVAGYTGENAFSREESLRAFGLLLREGKIAKVRHGYFNIAATTRFRPYVLAAGE